VALCATVVGRRRQPEGTVVFQVAGGTCGSEGLVRLMDRRIVASQARIITHIPGEGASPAHVTQVALLREDGMRT
jgi:hypothetical protein